MSTIRNPAEWGAQQLAGASGRLGAIGRAIRGAEAPDAPLPQVRRLQTADLGVALRRGWEDFIACRSDVVFVCVVYALVGLVAVRMAFNYDLLPLLFPAASGLALIGPATAIGLYEMSRRRERGDAASWTDGFALIGAPSFGAMLALTALLGFVFLFWMWSAAQIHAATLGGGAPESLSAFAAAVFGTAAGWAMIVVGCAVGFVFAAVALSISLVSFPLLLEREVGLIRAVVTSVRVAIENPRVVALWGLIVAVGLAAGSLPAFMGLIVVMPVLGHATWHLYRRAVV